MQSFKSLALTFLLALASAQDDRGQENIPGLGGRKQEVIDAGGDSLDLAIAMLETTNMGTDYDYGDNKELDASNFGIYKQNWGMLRQCASSAGFVGQSEGDWNNGALLNDDLFLDVTSRHECQEFFGLDIWFAGHRNGASGIDNPNTPDIQRYRSGVEWIQQQIESDPIYLSDDTRFWVDVTPI